METFVPLDFRIDNIERLIHSFTVHKEGLIIQQENSVSYGGTMLLNDVELILGMSFITLQNYINSSIFDCCSTLKRQYEKYNLTKKNEKSNITLIVALANYYKHKDSPGDIFKETIRTLKYFNLSIDKNYDVVDSPILKGFDILSENNELNDLIEIVKEWRAELFKNQFGNF